MRKKDEMTFTPRFILEKSLDELREDYHDLEIYSDSLYKTHAECLITQTKQKEDIWRLIAILVAYEIHIPEDIVSRYISPLDDGEASEEANADELEKPDDEGKNAAEKKDDGGTGNEKAIDYDDSDFSELGDETGDLPF